MNTGIKNKLKTLIGENVGLFFGSDDGIIHITFPSDCQLYKIERIEGEDCIVLSNNEYETFLSIDHISYVSIKKK